MRHRVIFTRYKTPSKNPPDTRVPDLWTPSELTTSAGLDDDDLGFVLKVAAVSIVENLEYGVIS